MGLNLPVKRKKKKFLMDPIEEWPLKEDVVGVGAEFLDEAIINIENDYLFTHVGLLPNKSYLLEGPPGVGKSFSVQALNNTLNKNYLKALKTWEYDATELEASGKNIDDLQLPEPKAVFFSYDIGRYGTAFINEGSRIIQDFFDNAYYYSLVKKVVLVFDEADALMSKRGVSKNHKEDDKVLETIMKNMQKLHETKNLYLVIMTNFREGIDEAVLRAGRIDKKYKFELPDFEARKLLLQRTINKLNKKADYQVIRNYNLDNLAEMTEGYNGADLVNIIEQTLRNRVVDLIKTRTNKIIPAIYVNGSKLEKYILEYNEKFKEQKKIYGF